MQPIDRPHARFWHRVSAGSRPEDCGAFAIFRDISPVESGIVLTDAPAANGRAHLVAGLACLVLAKLNVGASPAGALAIADRSVRSVRRMNEPPLDLACFVATLNRSTGVLLYASAGHDLAFILRPDGSTRMLSVTGPRLATLEKPSFHVRRIPLQSGGSLVAATAANDAFATEIARSARIAIQQSADPAAAVVETLSRFRPIIHDAGCAALVSMIEEWAA